MMNAPSIVLSVEQIDPVTLDTGSSGRLDGLALMSPYVWERDGCLQMLVRGLRDPLGPHDPTGVIYHGTSKDGLVFAMKDKPAIQPGSSTEDAGGVEDPTVVLSEKGILVFYTGLDALHQQGSMMVATGNDLDALTVQRVLLKAPPGEGNIKEATVAVGADGRFRLFYEYAGIFTDGMAASRIGMAIADHPEGPWQVTIDPFSVRDDDWDNWHLSTGPIVSRPGHPPIMFYNGATGDARWRIGWIAFDENYTRIVDRCIQPLIMPPPPRLRSGTDIAFAASCLDQGDWIDLYYSLEDRMLRRARVRHFEF